MTVAEDRALRQAFNRFDRLSAYGCTQRGAVFVVETMQAAWQAYRGLLATLYPEAWA